MILVCPITGEQVVTGVQDKEGFVYEKSAITDWLRENDVSPVSGRPMKIEDLQSFGNDDENNIVNVTVVQPKELDENRQKVPFLINCETENIQEQNFTHIVCVIDISGSMGSSASVQNQDGVVESSGLSVLDVVKHSVRTILQVLNDQDEISIVSYHDDAEIVCERIKCTKENKKTVLLKLDQLHPLNCTNLWAGLKTGMKLIEKSQRIGTIFLLTDGMPNVNPPRGIVPSLVKYISDNPNFKCCIHTFGFGYSLETQLLCDIATLGGGTFNFIPDGGMVGTVFIHATSNTLSYAGHLCTLNIELLNGATLSYDNPIIDIFDTKKTDWGAIINAGSIQYGQQRTFLVYLDLPQKKEKENNNGPYLCCKFSMENGKEKIQVMSSTTLGKLKDTKVSETIAKYTVCDVLYQIQNIYKLEKHKSGNSISSLLLKDKKKLNSYEDLVNKAIEIIKKNDVSDYTKSLLEDLNGQIRIAVSKKEFLKKWGVHYLPSLFFAHLMEICNNFKDPGIQNYSKNSLLFNKIRDIAEEAFSKMPPPKPSIPSLAQNKTPMKSMKQMYLNRSNPCFAGNCIVKMSDGTTKFVEQIRKDDYILAPNGNKAKVKCVVQTMLDPTQNFEMVHFPNGLIITPYHPILHQNRWTFPIDLIQPKEISIDSIYSFVLEQEHIMIINDISCVTLGHNFIDNDVIQHPYFGSQKIVDDLEALQQDGFVLFQSDPFVRDPITLKINGLK